MLVLSAHTGDEVFVQSNPPLRLKILKVRGNTVRLCFDLDPSVKIVRGKVLERQSEQREGGKAG